MNTNEATTGQFYGFNVDGYKKKGELISRGPLHAFFRNEREKVERDGKVVREPKVYGLPHGATCWLDARDGEK